MAEERWSEKYEVKEAGELPPIYQFKPGPNELYLDLSEEPREVSTKFGSRRVIKARTKDGNEVSVFTPPFSGSTSLFGQIIKLAREHGEREHLVNIFVVGEKKARRYSLIHDPGKCKCGKK